MQNMFMDFSGTISLTMLKAMFINFVKPGAKRIVTKGHWTSNVLYSGPSVTGSKQGF